MLRTVNQSARPMKTAMVLAVFVSMVFTIYLLQPQEPAEAGHPAYCIVHADNPHNSGHANGYINSIGRVVCDYNPPGPLYLQTRLMKRDWKWDWIEQSTTLNVLDNTQTYVRHSRSMPCDGGNYRTESRAYAAGPHGEPGVWSLWAVGFSVGINCP